MAPPCRAPGSQTRVSGSETRRPRTVPVMQRLSISSSEWSVGTHKLQTQSRAHGGSSSWRRPAWAAGENSVEEITGRGGVRRKPRGRAGHGGKKRCREVRRTEPLGLGTARAAHRPGLLCEESPGSSLGFKTLVSVKAHSRNDPIMEDKCHCRGCGTQGSPAPSCSWFS